MSTSPYESESAAGPRTGHRSQKPLSGLRRPLVGFLALVAVASGLVAVSGAVDAAEPIVIYGDELNPEYQNWSWTTVDLDSAEQVKSGATAMAAEFGPWEGLYLSRIAPTPFVPGASLEFWMHGGNGAAGPIQVVMVDGSRNGTTPVTVETTPDRWERYRIPVADFGLTGPFGGLWWQNASAGERSTIYIDDVRLIGSAEQDDPNTDGPALTVDLGPQTIARVITDPASGQVTNQELTFPHAISDGVYGLNFAAPTLLGEIKPGINRWGGNAVERYNRLNGTTNLGKDWYFMNSPGEVGNEHRFEDGNQAVGAETLLTVPAIGWIAGNESARCGYPLPGYAPMDDTEPHFLDGGLRCGNGRRGGETITANPDITSIAAGPDHTGAWVSDLVATHGSAADGGVEIYAIGNEPGLWHETHSDVMAAPATRQTIIDTNIAHATAIKGADPSAAVAGPVLWGGFSYYVTSAEMAAGQRPGDVPTFVEDYLKAMATAEVAAGIRLIDTLAINFYDDRVYYGGSDELRLESTRSLWDSSYEPNDWWVVRDFVGEGNTVIPRMKSLIDANYPGTELSITEYNFGGLDTLAGGLTQADALGIFGREGLDRAMLWDPFNEQLSPPESQFTNTPAMWAYRMYRNYDGNGARFGDRALYADSSDQSTLSIYAAERSTDDAITVMVINKSTDEQTSQLSLGTSGSVQVYNYGQSGLTSIDRLTDLTVDGTVTTTYPARSITLLVIEPNDGEPTPPTAPPTSGPTPSVTSTTITATTTSTSTAVSNTAAPTTAASSTTQTTEATPTTTLPTPVPQAGGVFTEDFVADDSFERFESGIFHRDDWVVSEESWRGDHPSTGPNDACGSPYDQRLIERGERSEGFNQDWIYRCRPGGDVAKAHLMTSIGDTSGYSIGAFTPKQSFSNVKEVRWDVNITDLGVRQFPEVKIIPADNFDFQNLPCSIDWLPCDTDGHGELGSVGTSFFNAQPAINVGGVFTKGDDWDAGYRDTAGDPARQSITIRRTHFFRDNGDGTLTFGIEKADGTFETVSAPGQFPSGEVRVVFADHNYTPTKDEPGDITFTWHWDDLRIETASVQLVRPAPTPPTTAPTVPQRSAAATPDAVRSASGR